MSDLHDGHGPADNARHECAVGIDAGRREPECGAIRRDSGDSARERGRFPRAGIRSGVIAGGRAKGAYASSDRRLQSAFRGLHDPDRRRDCASVWQTPRDRRTSRRRPRADGFVDRGLRNESLRAAGDAQYETLQEFGTGSGEPVGLTASDAKTLIVNGEPREIAAKNLAEALAGLSYAV